MKYYRWISVGIAWLSILLCTAIIAGIPMMRFIGLVGIVWSVWMWLKLKGPNWEEDFESFRFWFFLILFLLFLYVPVSFLVPSGYRWIVLLAVVLYSFLGLTLLPGHLKRIGQPGEAWNAEKLLRDEREP